jgi:hypothetical protein
MEAHETSEAETVMTNGEVARLLADPQARAAAIAASTSGRAASPPSRAALFPIPGIPPADDEDDDVQVEICGSTDGGGRG